MLKNISWSNFIVSIESSPLCFRVKEVFWKFPQGAYKLNTDGSSKGNPGPAAGGGILRDVRARLFLPMQISLRTKLVSRGIHGACSWLIYMSSPTNSKHNCRK